LVFLFTLRTGQAITKKEGFFLIGIYITFLLVEICTK